MNPLRQGIAALHCPSIPPHADHARSKCRDRNMAAGNRGYQVRGVCCLFLALTWTFIFLRAYCHIIIIKVVKIDDYLALLSQVRLIIQPVTRRY